MSRHLLAEGCQLTDVQTRDLLRLATFFQRYPLTCWCNSTASCSNSYPYQFCFGWIFSPWVEFWHSKSSWVIERLLGYRLTHSSCWKHEGGCWDRSSGLRSYELNRLLWNPWRHYSDACFLFWYLDSSPCLITVGISRLVFVCASWEICNLWTLSIYLFLFGLVGLWESSCHSLSDHIGWVWVSSQPCLWRPSDF